MTIKWPNGTTVPLIITATMAAAAAAVAQQHWVEISLAAAQNTTTTTDFYDHRGRIFAFIKDLGGLKAAIRPVRP